MSMHEARLNKIDKTLEHLEREIVRIRKDATVDYDKLCSKEDYDNLAGRLDLAEGSLTQHDT